jgi:hypothetical protein
MESMSEDSLKATMQAMADAANAINKQTASDRSVTKATFVHLSNGNTVYVPIPVREPPCSVSDSPKQYLTSWRDILVALGMKNSNENREKLRNLNTQYAGPILTPKQGAQPKANRQKLIEWWNNLEAQWTVGHQRARDSKPTAGVQHSYGADGIVAPEISGAVKQRRKDRQK